MNRGVCYLLTGADPWYRLMLLVSTTTLRRHYSGEVVVITDQNGLGMNVREVHVPSPPINERFGRNRWYHYKPQIARLSSLDSAVFLDCDTMVAGPLDNLFLPEGDPRLRLTRFADLTTTDTQVRHRLLAMVQAGLLHPTRCDQLMVEGIAAINTGVYAMTPAMAWADRWLLTVRTIDRFWLHDELAAQVLYPELPHDLVSDRFNMMPGFTKRAAEEAVIWHCPGGRYGRDFFPGKPMPAHAKLWYDTLAECWDTNAGDVRSWWPDGEWRLPKGDR